MAVKKMSRRNTKYTTEEFIKKSREVHGDKYDYSKVVYTGTRKKVIITCPIHGDFKQLAGNHMYGNKCNKCNIVTTEVFIKKAREVHGDKYDYSKVVYINNKTKVIITCPIHGDFEQTPNQHLRRNCFKCGNIQRTISLRSNKEEFIKKSREVHGDKYDYSKVVYINNKTKVIITCPIHGDFEQSPNPHLQGHNCHECTNMERSKSYLMNQQEWIQRAHQAHGDKYDYSKVIYNGDAKKVIITCPIHGDFKQLAGNHIRGLQCFDCGLIQRANTRAFTTKEFIKKSREVHGDKYDYSKVEYINSNTKVIITCPIHGDWEPVPNNHLRGSGCMGCGTGNYSKGSIEWLEWRMIRDNCFIQHAENIGEKKIENGKYKFDGFCEKTQIVYEYNGDYWHGNPDLFNPEDTHPLNKKTYGELYKKTIERKEYIINKDFHYISIWESEWLHIKKCVKKIQKWWKKNK